MSEPALDPCRVRLERDLASADVEAGVEAGLWRTVRLDWPAIFVAITAGDGSELGMRLQVDGYPGVAPAGQPWDLETNAALPAARWPVGGGAEQVFRTDWSVGNANAPYLACDRTGLATHPGWADAHPERAWHAGRTIAFYLSEIHHRLRGARTPQNQSAA